MRALEARYGAPAWAFLPQVANGTGANIARTADALAMSLWPSRGLELFGFEVKATRSDWLRELKDPAKADRVCRFCDRWFLVIGDEGIVQTGELPPAWGLLAPKSGKLVVKIEAPKIEPQPVTRAFLSAVLRRTAEYVAPRDEAKEAAFEAGYKSGKERGAEDGKREAARARSETEAVRASLEQLRATVRTFEEKSGVRIDSYNVGRIGEAVSLVASRHGDLVRSTQNMLREAQGLAEHLEKTLAALSGTEQVKVRSEA